MGTVAKIIVEPFHLNRSTADEYCRSVQKARYTTFWWYQFPSRLIGNYTRPFQDVENQWWYQVKPGFCWPVEILSPRPARLKAFPYSKSFIGYQYPIAESLKNSIQRINTIEDLPSYGLECIDAKRRNAIRKGLCKCVIEPLCGINGTIVKECRNVWSDFTARTGWKYPVSAEYIQKSWNELLDVHGATILCGREIETGKVAGFLITKLIGDTAFVDTIASRTDLLKTNVNDALLYSFLVSARVSYGIRKAHYAIQSYDTRLEEFKRSIGFTPTPYPIFTHLRPGVAPLLKMLLPSQFQRMTGI